MKKKLLAAVLAAAMVASLAACKGEEESSSSVSSAESTSSVSASSATSELTEEEQATYDSLYDPVLDLPLREGEFKLADCIKLGDYKNLGVSRGKAEVSDEDVESSLKNSLPVEDVEDPEAVVQEGDTIHLSYEGTIDGVAFDGGTSEDAELEIGSGSFIEGFEDGMVGMKVGEERDLALTFPEEYHSEDLAGKECNFHVQVLSIGRKAELTDAWVEEYTEGAQKTVDEYREHIREDLLESAQSNLDYQTMQELWNLALENAEIIALPADYVEKGETSFFKYYTDGAETYGMSLEEYLESSGLSQYEYELRAKLSGRKYARERLFQEAIIEAEKMTEDSEEFQKTIKLYEEYYAMTKEELYEQYGEDEVKHSFWNNAVNERLLTFASE